MKFLELSFKESGEFVNVNIDHIVLIEPHIKWIENDKYIESSKIHLSNGNVIIVAETMECIENEYKELFKYGKK